MATRVIVVGADAAGMSAASQAKRMRGDDLDIVAFDRGTAASYSACGIPYWIAGDVKSRDELIARSAEEHRKRGIYVHLRNEVTAIDLAAREVVVHDLDRDRMHRAPYDELVLATGAVARRPPIEGVDAPGVYGVQTLDDGSAVLAALDRRPRTAVVVGGGYVGIEMAEALLRRGVHVTVLESAAEPMSSLDPELGRLVHRAMAGMGIDVRVGTTARAIEVSDGRAAGVVTDDRTFPADLVVLGLGVTPNTSLVRAAGLWLGPSGGVRTDRRMRVVDDGGQPVENVWSAGDCVEVQHRVSGAWLHIALGTHANKQGRALGTNLGGGYATFPGVVGTAMTKVCDLEIARTGLGEEQARRAGFEPICTVTESTTRAGYFPGAAPITVKLIAERRTGRLLGAQIVGREQAAKRVDAAAVAIWNGMTVEEVMSLDLGYAPPYATVWDPVLIAARTLAEQLAG
jgi:NADPH-dependent 2,4-dienoyl-CoA reductase/sulfur reductase-like enzyme